MEKFCTREVIPLSNYFNHYLRIMKLTFIALILFSQGLFAVNLKSQTTRISITMTDVNVSKIIDEIEAQTDYLFLYDWEEVNLNKKTTIKAENESVAEVLTDIFRDTDIVYAVEGNSIFLMKKKFVQNAPSILQQQQKRIINGTVADEKGDPIIGANVVEKGTVNGVITDIDGKFSITASTNAILQVSYIGYITQDTNVGNNTSINVVLQEDTKTLDEVIVVGYGTQKKANLSGAVESVTSKRLESRSTNNVGLALQGIVPSLTIQPGNGQVNSTPSYNIRGMTSINGGSPLIMVDGVPTEPADFSRMNAADIENISVLKDASSAAIYGARAAFGVILVTTRKGDSEKLTVRFNNVYNMRKLGRMPDVVTDPYINASYREIMGAPWYHYYDEPTLEYAKELSKNPTLPNIIMDPLQPERWLYFSTTDWYKEVYGSGYSSSNSHNISISGKGDKVSYYLGAEYYRDRGVIKINRDVYDKFNVRSHIEYKPINWLTIGNNTSLQYYIYEMPTHLNSTFFWNMSYRAKSLYPVKNPDGTWADGSSGAASTNLIAELQDGGKTKTNQYVTQTQFNLDIALLKNVWHIKGDFTAKYSNNKQNAWANYSSTRKGPDLPLINFDMSYYGWDEYTQLSTWNKLYTMGNIYTDFSKTWGKHNLSALLGFSQEYERYETFTGKRKNMITPSYPTPQLATGAITLTENIYEWAIRSGFFRLNYIFNEKYIFETNGRYDGTSRFPKEDRFGFFPSVSTGWLISEEPFFSPLKKWLNYSKIRLSYGLLGNQDVDYYQYIATMNASKIGQLIDGDQPMGIYSPGLVSNNLTWEKISTFDVGLDLNFLSNRLSFSGDIFRRTTKDMLSKGKTLPAVLGTSEPKINAADLISKGWEVSLSWTDKINLAGKPLDYNARFILSDSRAFIKRFDNPTKYLGDYYEGQEIGEIWGLVTEGFFSSQEEIDSHANQVEVTSYPGDRPIEPGDLKYKDLNGDGVINRGSETVDDPGDFKVIGNNSLRYNFGLDLGGSWDGWDLRLLFQGVGKRDIYPDAGPAFWGIYYAPDAYVLKGTLDHWTPENPNAYLPRLKSYLTTNDLGIPQTRYLQNAAYVRMKNITFGYTLPESLLKSKIGVRIYFSGENLFEITSLRNPLDPEAEGSNIHPFQRSYSIGLNITL